MQIEARLRKLMIIGLLCCLLAIAPTTSIWAQDDDTETTPEAPVTEVEAEEESAEIDVEDTEEDGDTEDADEETADEESHAEDAESEEDSPSGGARTWILLIGLIAVVGVGGKSILQAKPKKSA